LKVVMRAVGRVTTKGTSALPVMQWASKAFDQISRVILWGLSEYRPEITMLNIFAEFLMLNSAVLEEFTPTSRGALLLIIYFLLLFYD